MKKFTISILALTALLSACEQSGVDALKEKKQSLISAYKTAVKEAKTEHETALHELDSLITNHPDYAGEKSEIKTIPVTVQNVQQKTFEHYFEVHGNVDVVENAALFAEAPGNVEKIHVQEGQYVKKGDVIITLDAGQMESGIKELEKAQELATKVYNKQKALWDQKIGSEIQYLETKNNKESLDQKLVTMREQLDMYKIRAPFAGVVDEIMPKVGESAAPGFMVARIMNLNKIFLESDVSEKYMQQVKKGGVVQVKFPSLGESVTAKVSRVGNFINPANRTFKVKVEFANPAGKYKPNQLAVLKIRDYEAENALVIPTRIVQQDRRGNDYVYTFEKVNGINRVKKVILSIGQSYNNQVEVLEGLTPEMVLIDKGAKSVQAGDAIEIK